MIFSLGGGKRLVVTSVSALTLTFSLAACSGSDAPSPLDEPSASATASATPDQAAVDQAAVSDLVTRYWGTVVSAENNGNTDRSQFSGVAEGEFLEDEFRKLDGYAAQDIKRVGAPKITAIDVDVNGDSALVAHCIDEDEWTAVKGDEPLDPILSGNRPFGLTAARTGDTWIITGTGLPDAQEKAKECP